MLTISNSPNLETKVRGYTDKHKISIEDFLIEAVEKLLAEKSIEPNETLSTIIDNIEYTSLPLNKEETKAYLDSLKSL